MAGIRLIRRRIKSAKNIAQITKAMQMVAASKMKRAQEVAVLGKPYADKIYQAVAELVQLSNISHHKLLSVPSLTSKTLVVLISTNKGLCGSLNTNLFRRCLGWFIPKENYEFLTLGTKGAKFVLRTGYKLIADFSDKIPFNKHGGAVTDIVIDNFLKGYYKQVLIVYSAFINALNINPEKRVILPMSDLKFNLSEQEFPAEFLIEPSPKQLLDTLLPHYLETQIIAAILQAEAAEHSSRMLAMRSATDNALDLSSELTLIYNKLRQEQITYEIADITRAQLTLSS